MCELCGNWITYFTLQISSVVIFVILPRLAVNVVSAFCFSTCTKMPAPLPDCCISNALIQFVPSCQDARMQFVDVLDQSFSDIACSIISCLLVEIFMPENNIVTNFCDLVLGSLVIMRFWSPCPSVEWSAAARYVSAVSWHFSVSPEDPPFHSLLWCLMIVQCLRSDISHFGHYNRFCYLLNLLTYC